MSEYTIGWPDSAWPKNLTYRQCDHWTTRGYLHVDRPSRGPGSPRRWPRCEAAIAASMLRLIAAGMLPRAASVVARAVFACAPGEPATVELAPGVILVVGQADRAQVPA